MKLFTYVFIAVLLGLFIHPTSKASTTLFPRKFADIELVLNHDSLENQIKSIKQKDLNYLHQLIVLERSRTFAYSFNSGNYGKEIINLGQKYNNLFATTFGYYTLIFRTNIFGIKNIDFKEQFMWADSAISGFKQLNDPIGLMHVYVQVGTTESNIIAIVHPKRINLADEKNKIDTVYETKRLNNILYKVDSLAQLLPTAEVFLLHIKLQMRYYYIVNTSYDDIRLKFIDCLQKMKSISKQDSTLYTIFFCMAYNYMGNVYGEIENVNDSSLYYYELGLHSMPKYETSMRWILYINIAGQHLKVNNYIKAKLYADKVEKGFFDFEINKDRVPEMCYYVQAAYYEKMGDYKKANDYLHMQLENKIHFLHTSDINNYVNFLHNSELSQVEMKAHLLEERGKRNKLIIWASIVIAVILLIFSYFQVRATKKTKRALNEIKILEASRDKFYSIVAHDLRSPIASLNGFGKIIIFYLAQKKYDAVSEMAQRIETIGTGVNNMLSNLMQWSIKEQGQTKLNMETFSISQILVDIVELYKPVAITKGVSIDSTIQEDISIQSDEQIIHTILRNVIDNAIKYAIAHTHTNITLSKLDNGCKLEVSNHAQISEASFERMQHFLSEQKNLTSIDGRRGLGLILIKDFIDRINAKIKIDYTNEIFSIQIIFP